MSDAPGPDQSSSEVDGGVQNQPPPAQKSAPLSKPELPQKQEPSGVPLLESHGTNPHLFPLHSSTPEERVPPQPPLLSDTSNTKQSQYAVPTAHTPRAVLLRALAKRLQELFWESFGVKSVGEDVSDHALIIKHKVRVLIILLFVILAAGGAGSWIKGTTSSSRIDALHQLLMSNEMVIRDLNSQVTKGDGQMSEKNSRISELTTQESKWETIAKDDENALAPWKMLANSQYTNAPLNKRLDLMFEQVASLTNALGQFDIFMNSDKPKFELLINDITISNLSLVQEKPGKEFSITARNSGTATASGVTISLNLLAAETNVTANGWQRQPAGDFFIGSNFIKNPGGNCHLVVRSDNLTAGGNAFASPPISISTNCIDQFMPVVVQIYSEKSSKYEYTFILYLRSDKR